MLHSTWRCIVILLCFSILEEIHGQNIIGSNCTVTSTGSSGTCKLITKCKKVRDELVQYNRLPQACGFVGTQTIVCCPKKVKKPGDISRQKCREYSGLKGDCDHKIVKRVVAGQKASREEFPHMAQLGFQRKSGETIWPCAGTIISERYILTAAHCLNSTYGDPKFVRVGFINVDDTEHRQEFNVSDAIVHPSYNLFYNDLGLVKLEKPIRFNSFAQPACLHTRFQIPDEKVVATGWRKTGNGFSSKDLLKITLELADYEFCRDKYDKVLPRDIVDKEQICIRTDVNEEPRDTCATDTGGPLQIYNDDLCMYDVIGITSVGTKICSSSFPPVYTRVSHYVKWIEDIVWPQPSDLVIIR